MQRDSRGVPLSETTPKALALFERAFDRFQARSRKALSSVKAALAEDPDFILAHLLHAGVLAATTEARFGRDMERAVAEAEHRGDQANERERGLTHALRCWCDGFCIAAAQAFDRVLERYPCDALALQLGHAIDVITGNTCNLRGRCARVLPHWDEDTPGFSSALGMYALGLEENNLFEMAEDTGRRALALEPGDTWSTHAVALVLAMQSRVEEGIDFLRTRRSHWDADADSASHNWWLLALLHLERSDPGQALSIYDARIEPGPFATARQRVDATNILWRAWLLGLDTGPRWTILANCWAAHAEIENGFNIFNDLHACLAYAADGRDQALARLLDDVRRSADRGGTNAAMARELGLPACRAVRAFGRCDYSSTIELLMLARACPVRLGGTRAQCDLLDQTLLEAAIRGGRHALAYNLSNERIEAKPDSPLTWRLRARALEATKADFKGIAEARAANRALTLGRRIVFGSARPCRIERQVHVTRSL